MYDVKDFHNNPVMITPEYHTELVEEFHIYYCESGMSTEFVDMDEQEFDFISAKLGTDDWDILTPNNLLSMFNKR